LRRMQEEKRKRENFGNKLHEMLDSWLIIIYNN
jgi:hypothetical protein